jgi:hypothetical protein
MKKLAKLFRQFHQNPNPYRQLEYKNLLGACQGGEGQKPNKQHCDTKKGNIDLTFNPADPAHDLESKKGIHCQYLLQSIYNFTELVAL